MRVMPNLYTPHLSLSPKGERENHEKEGGLDWLNPVKDIFGAAAPVLDQIPLLRAVITFVLMFFLPGFAWTLVFFKGKQLSKLERGVLSVGISIAVVTLSITAASKLLGVKITGLNSLMIILIMTALPFAIYYLTGYFGRRRSEARR